MIRFKKDGRYLDVSDGDTITTEWVSTVFNDDAEFAGSYTYPVHGPLSPNNNALLNNAQLIENRSARYASTVVIEIFGRPWKQAKLTFDVTPDGYDMNCLIDTAEFANLIKEQLLPDVFINYVDGQFSSFINDRVADTPEETIKELVYRANNPGKGSCVFFSQKNDGMFGDYSGDGNPPYDPNYTINNYEDTPEFLAYCQNETNRPKAFYIPAYYMRWVILQVCKYLGFEATGDFFNDPRTLGIVIDNSGFLDLFDVFAFDGCRLSPAKHLPNIKLSDFFKKLRASFKLAIYFDGNERKAYFNYAPSIVASKKAVDISGYVEPGHTIKTYLPTGYTIIQPADENDSLFKTFEYVKSYVIGYQTNPQKLDTYIGTLFMTDVTEKRPGSLATWRVPRKRQTGNGYSGIAQNTESYNDGGYNKNDYDLRQLTYRGVRFDQFLKAYYYASSDDKEIDNTVYPGYLSCWLGGDNGMIANFIKDWLLYFLRTEEVQIKAHLPPTLFMQLSPLLKITWTTGTRVIIPAMISQASFEQSIKYDDRVYAELTIYPIYNQAASDIKAFKEVQTGEVENEGKIYVKFRLVETSRETKKAGAMVITTAIFQVGYLDFFSDEACTKQRAVSNLPVNMIYNYRGKNARNYIIDQPFQVKASGTSYQIPDINQTYVNQGSDNWNKYYRLADGPDYIVKDYDG